MISRVKLQNAMLRYGAAGLPAHVREEWIMERLNQEGFTDGRRDIVDAHLEELFAVEPSSALSFVRSLPSSPLRDSAILSLAKQWVLRDPLSASDWIVELPPGETRDLALATLVRGTRDDPEAALRNAVGIARADVRVEAASDVVDWWKKYDPQFVTKLIKATPMTEGDRSALLKRIAP